VPEVLYADRIGIYFVSTKKPAGKTLDKIQSGHIAERLGRRLVPAGSSQAKGRIEPPRGDTAKPPTHMVRVKRYYHDGTDQHSLAAFHRGFQATLLPEASLPGRKRLCACFGRLGPDTLLAAKYSRKMNNCGGNADASRFKTTPFRLTAPVCP
jgi:hypothetical protein